MSQRELGLTKCQHKPWYLDFPPIRDDRCAMARNAIRRRMVWSHPDTLASMDDLARTLADEGDYAGARLLEERVLEAQKRLLGEEPSDSIFNA